MVKGGMGRLSKGHAVAADHTKFKMRLDLYTSIWCCINAHPGHIWCAGGGHCAERARGWIYACAWIYALWPGTGIALPAR